MVGGPKKEVTNLLRKRKKEKEKEKDEEKDKGEQTRACSPSL